MSTAVCERPADLEQLFYQATADHEFRTELLDHPRAFGFEHDVFLPHPVEAQELISLGFWSEGMAALDCTSTCSAGVFTVVCDGNTK